MCMRVCVAMLGMLDMTLLLAAALSRAARPCEGPNAGGAHARRHKLQKCRLVGVHDVSGLSPANKNTHTHTHSLSLCSLFSLPHLLKLTIAWLLAVWGGGLFLSRLTCCT